ncbi:hypothetical protein CAPTEDRAFT_227291 [Capitella teleta]|uniref:Uncharacterized protein n=1 Tax=Capitella teleta TaxID=283909 RepID=R7UMX3_CAPTE|nr:hypothetical protein CAPTEDRAFT_227291 [Capitella teleta]|eukprot:ELU05292.1 hypothetical protein CAPTEDRAFT_227291 [Capitella teleta]
MAEHTRYNAVNNCSQSKKKKIQSWHLLRFPSPERIRNRQVRLKAPINLLKVLLPLFAVIAIFSLLTALWLKCKYTERIKNYLNVPIERVQTTERPMTERINNKTSDYVCLGDSCEASSSSSTNSSELSPSSTQTKHSSLSSSSGFSGDSPNPSSVTSSELPPSDPSSSSGFTGDSSKTSSFTSSDDLCPPTSTSDSQSSSSGINSSPSLTSNQGPSSSTGVYMRVRYKDITPKEPAKEICVDSNDRDLLAVCLSNNTSDCSSVGLESPIEDDYCRQAKIHSSAPLEEPNEIRVDDDDPELAAHLAKRVETPCSSQSTVLEMSTESKKRHSPHQSAAGDFESETVVDSSCSIEMENLGDAGTTSDHDAEEVPSDVEGTDATADVQVESSQCILTQFGDKADNFPSSILPSITRSNILPSLSDTNSVPESRILPSFCIPTPSTSPFHLDGGVSPDEGIHSMEFPENGTISEDPSDRLEEDLDGNIPTYGGHYITGAHESQA